ncbi:chemotaxis protein CheB [Candidatus Magnetominusculus dajiuhuensis]|uniref:chemotaxis protein CheB n=1 Tax=Candidatus Magnetominusculus dajiuhuensis TaxID=3137712 RepID=UPI003B42CDF0
MMSRASGATVAYQGAELLIAGVGASAGGLEAMLSMFAHMRPTGRIAYVVAQHMAHNAHSELVVRLIQRESSLPVVLARGSMQLEADCVYVIPASMDGVVRGTMLTLQQPLAGQLSTPSINTLLASIADSAGKRAIGIVLSGAGSDGLSGCRSIRNSGGLTLAQDPTEAKHYGIPSGVIKAGLIDRVLPAAAIGETLATIYPGYPGYTGIAESAKTPSKSSMPRASATAVEEPVESSISRQQRLELEQLLRQVADATGIDFSSYKEETLIRRLEKRKSVLGVASADAYQGLIRRDPEELHMLQRLFLVSMSSFFRDRASFSVLMRVLAAHIKDKMDG